MEQLNSRYWYREYKAEREFLTRKEAAVNNEIKAVGELIQFADSLQHRVKQLLEVMDEHYGNMIRVFTMVTVLFTPLYVTQYSLVFDSPGR